MQTHSTVDVIGVIVDVGPIGAIKIKSDGSERDKRTITIMDETGYSVSVTMWGKSASIRGLSVDSIVALKNCRVTDY